MNNLQVGLLTAAAQGGGRLTTHQLHTLALAHAKWLDENTPEPPSDAPDPAFWREDPIGTAEEAERDAGYAQSAKDHPAGKRQWPRAVKDNPQA